MLGAVVEGLLDQQMRWQLNDLARRYGAFPGHPCSTNVG